MLDLTWCIDLVSNHIVRLLNHVASIGGLLLLEGPLVDVHVRIVLQIHFAKISIDILFAKNHLLFSQIQNY